MRGYTRKYPMGEPDVVETRRTPSGGESRTHTSFTDDCDLRKKVARLVRTGELEDALRQPPLQYGDFSNSTDYLTALMKVKQANEDFMSLPAEVRREFRNDPAELLAAFEEAKSDQDVHAKLKALGVFGEPEAEPPVVTPEAPTPQDPAPEGA